MLGVSTNKVKAFASTPFSALTRVKPMSRIWPCHGCWCFWRFLAHFTDKVWQDLRDWCRMCCWNRMSFVPWAEFQHAKKAGQPAGLEKTCHEKANGQNYDFIRCTQPATTLHHRQQQPPEQQPWGSYTAGYCTWRRTRSMCSRAEQCRLHWALLYYRWFGFEDCASCLTIQ